MLKIKNLFIIFIICLSILLLLHQIKVEAVSRFNVTIEYCTENWNCMDWSDCIGGIQTRLCTDLNECGTEENKPSESQACCEEDWSCTDWSACKVSVQTRTCTDLNNCGTEENKPPEIQVCTVEPIIGRGVSDEGEFIERIITPAPPITPPPNISNETVTSDIQLSLEAPERIESGEPFVANVTIKNNVNEPQDIKLKILGREETISLDTNEEKIILFNLIAPEVGGPLALVVEAYDGTYSRTSKNMYLEYKPLFLYVMPIAINTYQIHVKNFENKSTTEINVLREGIENVYLEVLNGSFDYKFNLTFEESGNYDFIAKTRVGLDIIDVDKRTFYIRVIPLKKINYLIVVTILLIIFSVPLAYVLYKLFLSKRWIKEEFYYYTTRISPRPPIFKKYFRIILVFIFSFLILSSPFLLFYPLEPLRV